MALIRILNIYIIPLYGKLKTIKEMAKHKFYQELENRGELA